MKIIVATLTFVLGLVTLCKGQTKTDHSTRVSEPRRSKLVNEKMENGKLIDLSHTIEHGLVTYKGLPAPIICDYLSREDSKKRYAEGTEFQIAKIEMVANTGTYIDCPFHRFAHGKDLSEIGLESFTDLDAIVISIPFSETLEITQDHLKNYKIKNRAVLIHTGWDKNWNTERYYENHPYLTEGAAKFLRDNNVTLVGIDSHNIDSTSGNARPAHTTLLGAGILIVEHLCNLFLLPQEGFTFSAIPPKFKGVGTFPVRAMAKLKN
jgi:arylformamidase